MAALMKPIRTVRNHWKKSLFCVVIAGFGVRYGLNRYECDQIMKVYCKEAVKYSLQTIGPTDKCRHVTVLMNPTANNGKGKTLFDKYAAPILNLAGIKVSIVKTENEGQARALMEVMDNTDAVVVSGGDGTVLEVVTGLMRRQDAETAIKKYPIGIIPIGVHNSLTSSLFEQFLGNEARYVAECAISIVRNSKKNVDVLQVSSDDGKSIYAVSNIEWSAYRDTFSRVSKYWMFGPLKSKVIFLFESITKWPMSKIGSVSFTPPCTGCSKCFVKNSIEDIKPATRWWQAFIPKTPQVAPTVTQIDYSQVENESCNQWTELKFDSSDFKIELADSSENNVPPTLLIKLAPEGVSRTNYIKEGWRRSNNAKTSSTVEVKLQKAKNIKLTIDENLENEWFAIDSENFEAKSINIDILSKKLQIFCPTS